MGGRTARRIVVTGRVQGVGYRPFVYRVAHELGLAGWVLNGAGKVLIEVEGDQQTIARFQQALVDAAPPLAQPRVAASEPLDPAGRGPFEIRASEALEAPDIHVPPDLFTCDDCIGELTDPSERRHRYPFINCTQCGPRYTLITAMPYDRPNTSMAGFPLCADCRREYESPLDRRFHAQPLACEVCGPELRFGAGNDWVSGNAAALEAAVSAVREGRIIAVKGVGGYHLVCDARSDAAVRALRERKHRPDKPLAVMFPIRGGDGLDLVRQHTRPTAAEAGQIRDPARPIVLVHTSAGFSLSRAINPALAEIGVFLPYSPLHHLLLEALGAPIVATSGNLSGEPVITDEREADTRLGGICDAFLHHDRPIVRPADDPVIRVIGEQAQLIRPGRGVAPLELDLPAQRAFPATIALGGHMKNTIALAWGQRLVLSPHIGELDSPRSLDVFQQVIADLQELYGVEAERMLCDAHPGYASTRWATRQSLPVQQVYHHHAHASALAGEHPDVASWLVFTWDGVGYCEDGTLWCGEALAGAPGQWRRAASFRPLRLIGGDRAGREPWRSAAAMLWADKQATEWPIEGIELAHAGWLAGTGTHESSAAGRLFDGAAALVLGRHHASFEGQGPMELEAIASGDAEAIALPLAPDPAGLPRSDWAPLLPMLRDPGLSPGERAAMFHESMARALLDQALRLREQLPFTAVGLSGGVFQNRRLTERAVVLLGQAGIDVRTHRRVPANDAGLCFGQVIECLGAASHFEDFGGKRQHA
jgi:hydrogenase maturation protein HypF